MTRILYAIGGFCSRRSWIVIVLWLVLAIGLGVLAKSLGENLNNNLTLPGTDSQAATSLLQDKFPEQSNAGVPIVFVAPAGSKLTEARYKQAVDDAYAAYKKDDSVRSATSPFSQAGSSQLAKSGDIAYIELTLKTTPSDMTPEDAEAILDIAGPAKSAGLKVWAGGYVGDDLSTPTSDISEGVGLTAAVIILLLTFGTLVAMAMPITTAVLGLAAGLSLLTIVGHLVDVPSSAPALATMIGLGVAIDYGLFIVTQHRVLMTGGLEPREAAARAAATAGGAVVFAGSTVIVALLSLLVAGIPIVGALGYTSAIVVLVAMLAAITLLPAVLGATGRHIESFKLPWVKRGESAGSGNESPRSHGWTRFANLICDHPAISIAVALILIAVLTYPALSLSLGSTDDGTAPSGTQARESYDAIAKGFGEGANGPLLVAVSLDPPAKNDQKSLDTLRQETELAPAGSESQSTTDEEALLASKSSDPRLQSLMSDIQKTKGVASVSEPDVNSTGTAAIYSVVPQSAPSAAATKDLVTRLREEVLPSSTKGEGLTAHVGGQTAGYIDLATQISDSLPQVIALVLALSFLLLMVAFRSILVPLKAIVMNLLSIGAAFGIVNYVFSHHWTTGAVGLGEEIAIVSFVPLMMFAILFGLSMDYEVFLMSHMRERYLATGDARRAVVEGLAGTARVITSAALIMVAVFCAFILSDDPDIKEFGVGMAAAVLVDATIIRCLLVPALMRLFGDAAWWYPRWLEKITPQMSIEGKQWFEERDARAAAAGD